MFEQKIQKTIKSFKMISPGDGIVVAVSGGPDSVALLHYLNSVKNISLHIAHLNHGIRGKNADRDALFVKKLAQDLGLPCSIKKTDVPALAKKLKVSLEEAGRIARYRFFEETAEKINADRIAVAHNADDNIETFLMRIERGTGLRGLCAIPPVRGRVIRPMIDVWKEDVLKYSKDNNLEYRGDETNLESKYTRNRVRNILIPRLLKKDPGIKEKLLSEITEINAQYAPIYKEAERLLKEAAASRRRNGQIVLDSAFVKQLPNKARREVIRHAIEKVKGDLNNISFKHIENIINLKRSYINLPENMFALVDGNKLIISNEKPKQGRQISFKQALKIPGSVNIKIIGKTINASCARKAPAFKNLKPACAYMDYFKISGARLIARSFRPGDNFIPLGMKGHKKLHDYFIDQKIPAEERCRVPIICDKDKIVWIAGYRLDDRVKIDGRTKKIVCLRIARR